MAEEDELRLCKDGVVHELTTDYDTVTKCGLDVSDVGVAWQHMLTLDPVSCMFCLCADEEPEVYFRCACSWVGGDPDYVRGRPKCPACWKHDRKRVDVTPQVR